MTEIPQVSEKYKGQVTDVVLGKGDYIVGGEQGMPFLAFDSPVEIKKRPIIAGEVIDTLTDYPKLAEDMFSGRAKDPIEWAEMWKQIGADMICIRFYGLDPEKGDTTPEKATEIVRKIVDRTGLPVMVSGCGILEKDVPALTMISEQIRDTRLLLNKVDEDEYKKVSTMAIAGNHCIVGFSNLDVNLAKQMNILLSDFGVKREDVIMDPLMAPLGMGMEYSYSVNERIRISGLMGDKMLQAPIICDCTACWDVTDAVSTDDPSLGDAKFRVTWWEAMTAMSAIISGADILVMRGPGAADMMMAYCKELVEVDE